MICHLKPKYIYIKINKCFLTIKKIKAKGKSAQSQNDNNPVAIKTPGNKTNSLKLQNFVSFSMSLSLSLNSLYIYF